MKFLVSYKVVKRCIQTDKIVENIDSLILDTRSTSEHPIEFKNVVDENTDIVKKLKNGECQLMKDFCPVNGSMDSKFDFLTKLDQANLISGCI